MHTKRAFLFPHVDDVLHRPARGLIAVGFFDAHPFVVVINFNAGLRRGWKGMCKRQQYWLGVKIENGQVTYRKNSK